MALTKHQKLARGIKILSEALDTHYQKTACILNVLQFHFYETHLLIGRALMSKQTLRNMMQTHRLGMQQFSANHELKSAALHSPFIGCILTPHFYPQSKVMHQGNRIKKDFSKFFLDKEDQSQQQDV